MTNQEIAQLFSNIAAVYQLKGEDRFRMIAYEKAAESIRGLTQEVSDLWKENKLSSIPGVGSSLASHIDELLRTGKVKHFQQVLKDIPESVFQLLLVPGLGIKRAFKLVTHFHITDDKSVVEKLLSFAKAGKIASIEGFGEKSQNDIIQAIERFKRGQIKENRMPLPYAYTMAQEVIEYLKKCPLVKTALPLGSLRRMVSTIGDVDVAVSTTDPKKVTEWFLKYPKRTDLVETGPQGTTILLTNGRQVDMRVISPHQFGAMVQYFTGNKNHNIKLREYALKKGLSLNEYGMRPIHKTRNIKHKTENFNKKSGMFEFPTEEGFYEFLGLKWIPPELREDRGEIEASLKGRLPQLVNLKDIKGDFHIHSNFPIEPSHDLGDSTLQDLLTKAHSLKYEYIGISDHNPSVGNHTKQQIISILKRRRDNFEQIISSTKSVRVKLLIMIEADIMPDGSLSIPDDGTNYLDAMIVSVHSSFGMSRDEMTKRVIKGLAHPKAKILAHPTGRLINKREGYQLDWDKLFEFCSKNNKALEINAYPDRLDLTDSVAMKAKEHGVKITIDTDSHEVTQMSNMSYGVAVAKRAWLTPSDIINTMSYNEVKKWIG